MCLGKVTLRCPNCRRQFVVTRPDSSHPSWSLDKPENKPDADVIEQVYDCKNPNCKSTFTVYWHDTQMFLDRA